LPRSGNYFGVLLLDGVSVVFGFSPLLTQIREAQCVPNWPSRSGGWNRESWFASFVS